MMLIIYFNALICVMTLTSAMLANFNVINACTFVNANYAKKIFVNCLISRAQKNKSYLLFQDFTELAQDIFY